MKSVIIKNKTANSVLIEDLNINLNGWQEFDLISDANFHEIEMIQSLHDLISSNTVAIKIGSDVLSKNESLNYINSNTAYFKNIKVVNDSQVDAYDGYFEVLCTLNAVSIAIKAMLKSIPCIQ